MDINLVEIMMIGDESNHVRVIRHALMHCYVFDTADIGFRIDPALHLAVGLLGHGQKLWLINSFELKMRGWLLERFGPSLSSLLN